ncbi:response regulator [soil metagenome]
MPLGSRRADVRKEDVVVDEPAFSSQVLRSLSDAIVVLALDGTVRFANPSAAALFGVDDLRGRSFDAFLDEVGRRHSALHLANAAQGRFVSEEVDTMLVRGDGSPLWVRLRQTPFLDGDRVDGVVLRLSDNHDTKRLLEEVHTSHRALLRAEHISRSGSWTWDLVAGTTTSSEGLAELYGDRTTDLLGKDRGRLLEMTHPEDRRRLAGALDGLLSGTAPRVDVEVRQQGRRGWMWVRARAVGTYDGDGRLTEASGTYQDITRARDTEDRLQDLVTQNSLMQAVATAANTAASLDEILEQAGSLVVLHDDWDRARAYVPDPESGELVPYLLGVEGGGLEPIDITEIAAIEDATAAESYRTGTSVWDADRRLTLACPIRLDEEIIAIIAITSLPPLYRHEMIQQMLESAATLIARVAERERGERDLAVARDRALDASRHKSEFLATMSHEIRTPLNGIIGLNELLDATSLSDRQQHLVTGITVSSRTLLDLINDILDFSKIEAGRFELETVDFEVREVLAQVGNLIAESARTQDVDLQVSCSPDVPDVVAGDPTRLKQVLLNLASNAVKFTAHGSVSMRATTQQASTAPDPSAPGSAQPGATVLRVEVRDTGIGISPEQQDQIFAPFSQADSSTTRHFGGSGLGLAICAEIVAAFGGEIGVTSTPEVGSTFWFTAPLGPPIGSTQDATLARARQELGRTRILVVDDNEQNRMILREQLSGGNVSSSGSDGAAAALEAVAAAHREDWPYDAILLDLAMPGHDGLAVAAAVRRGDYPSDVPIMLLSSSFTPPDDDLRAVGITTCLTKPVPSSTLREALLDLLRHQPHVEAPQPAPVAASSQGRVLVVEDNQINQIVARGFLEALGYTVDTADDGEDALVKIARRSYDAVLMDVQMPRLDGYATTRVVRREETAAGGGHRLPVIAVTATAVAGEREKCLSAGMDDFITKPLSPSALAEVLRRWTTPDGSSPPPPGTHESPPGDAGDAGPASPHLDRERLGMLLDLAPDDTAYLDRAIDRFLHRRLELRDAVAAAVSADDAAALSAAAHALRGSTGNLGLPLAAEVATELEEVGRAGSTSGAGPLLERLDQCLDDAAVAITAYREWYRSR